MAGTLYENIADITEDYLGPATPRFLNRIAMNHLGKPATKLAKSDLPELITWVKMAANILSEDTKEIQAFVSRLTALVDKPKSRSAGTARRKMSAA
jgi:hypothetical protein